MSSTAEFRASSNGPCFDFVVQTLSRAGGRLGLSVTQHCVIILQITLLHRMCHQVFSVLQHRLRGCRIFKVADEDNANAVAVVVGCVRALQAEATALVDTAIARNYEVVANIAKLAALLVIGLNVLDEALAFRLGAAGIRNVGMMNDDIVDLAGYACG